MRRLPGRTGRADGGAGTAARSVPDARTPSVRIAVPEPPAWLAAGIAAVSGLALWLGARGLQLALAPLLAGLADWARLSVNAAGEEALRFALALAAAAALARLGIKPRWALLGVLASCAFAAAEHVAYALAFPSADVYWRVGYAGPIHANAAALYALVLAGSFPAGHTSAKAGAPAGSRPAGSRPAGRALRAAAPALGLALGWAWHAAFNLAAWYLPSPLLPPLGTALNLVAMAALAWAAERVFVIGGTLNGRA